MGDCSACAEAASRRGGGGHDDDGSGSQTASQAASKSVSQQEHQPAREPMNKCQIINHYDIRHATGTISTLTAFAVVIF